VKEILIFKNCFGCLHKNTYKFSTQTIQTGLVYFNSHGVQKILYAGCCDTFTILLSLTNFQCFTKTHTSMVFHIIPWDISQYPILCWYRSLHVISKKFLVSAIVTWWIFMTSPVYLYIGQTYSYIFNSSTAISTPSDLGSCMVYLCINRSCTLPFTESSSQTDSPIQWMTCKARRSTTCLRFNKHTWIPMVLCKIFNCSLEISTTCFLLQEARKERLRSMITLKKYFCFRLLIVASKIDQYQMSLVNMFE
jgi:hypothetical protein